MSKIQAVKILIIIIFCIIVCILGYKIYKIKVSDQQKITWINVGQNEPKVNFSFIEFAETDNLDIASTTKEDTEIFLEGSEQTSNLIRNLTNKFDDTSKLVEQFYEEYESKIRNDKSWNEVLSLQADGPGSSQTGYRRINDSGQEEYIIFSYHTEYERKVPDGANECPCSTVFKIFKGVQAGSKSKSIAESNFENKNLNIEYRMVNGLFGKYRYPQIVNYTNTYKKTIESVNEKLKMYFGEVGCKNDFEADIRVTYAQNFIFSVVGTIRQEACSENTTNVSGYYYIPLTFDLRTGEEVLFDELFTKYMFDKDKILSLIYKDQIADSVNHPSACNTLEMLRETSHKYEFSTTTRTLLVTPQYPYVSSDCTESVRVPVNSLLPYLKQNSFLKSL